MPEEKNKGTEALKKAKKNKEEDNESYNKIYISEMMNKVTKKIDQKDPAVLKALRSMMDDKDNPFKK